MSLEKAFGRIEWESEKREDINELLSVSFETPSILAVHIEVSETGPIQKLGLLKNGFRALAEKLLTEEKYKNVHSIVGYSAIASLHPGVVREFGFASDTADTSLLQALKRKYRAAEEDDPVPPKYQAVEPQLVRITRDEFLRRYGVDS